MVEQIPLRIRRAMSSNRTLFKILIGFVLQVNRKSCDHLRDVHSPWLLADHARNEVVDRRPIRCRLSGRFVEHHRPGRSGADIPQASQRPERQSRNADQIADRARWCYRCPGTSELHDVGSKIFLFFSELNSQNPAWKRKKPLSDR